MSSDNVRVDTTFIGFFLIGFILLLLGVFGLENGGLFGPIAKNYHDMPLDFFVLLKICLVVGLILVLLAIFAYRTGKKVSATIFLFFAASMIFFCFDNYHTGPITSYNSNWFLYVALTIFYLIITIYTLLDKAPRFVTLLLLILTLMFFFTIFASFNTIVGPGDNNELFEAFSIVYGIFAFLGFIIATYLGLAYANPKKIPLI